MADITVEILKEIRSEVGGLQERMGAFETELRLHGVALRGLAVGQHEIEQSLAQASVEREDIREGLIEATVQRREIRETLGEVAVLLRQVAEDHELRIAALETD